MSCMILHIVLLAQLSGTLLTSLMQQSLSPLGHLGHFHALLVRFWSFWALCPMRVGHLMHCHHFHDNMTAWAGLVHFCGRVVAPVPVQGKAVHRSSDHDPWTALVQGCQGASPGSQRCRHLSMATPFVCFFLGGIGVSIYLLSTGIL